MPIAKKTPAAKTPATKPGASRAVVPWEAEMAKRAAKSAKQEVPMSFGKRISISGGQMSIDGEPVPDNELRVVVLAVLHENQRYVTNYRQGVPTVPECYAFNDPKDEDSKPEETMHAHDNADNPQGQDDPDQPGIVNGKCSDCWANVMGTADVGRGKACKNIRRVMVIMGDDTVDAATLEEAEMRQLSLPVMSTNNWSKFVNKVADEMSRDPSGVIATVRVVPDKKAQFVVEWEFEELVNFDQALWDAMEKKRADAMRDLSSPYPSQADLAPAQQVKPQGRMAQAMSKGKPAPAPAGKGTKKF